jgi:sugar lactone lactonase YvrE
MKNSLNRYRTVLIASVIVVSMALPVNAASAIRMVYNHNFSSFNGPLLAQWAIIFVDRERNETYVIDRIEREIKIYNEFGMEVFVFGDTGNLGVVYDLTVDSNGDIVVISSKGGAPEITRCNYRGEPKETIRLKNLPSEFSNFAPRHLIHREGKLYLLDNSDLRIAVVDLNGVFETGYDIAPLIDVPDDKRNENEITGFNLDADGNMLFTVSVLFQAFRLSPEGQIESFGVSGSAPGAFGVIAGIVSDERGYVYVADKLKCAVLVFDKNLEFKTEFGFRGDGPQNLIVPNDIDTDSHGNLFVSQGANRGISVFRALYE